MESYHIPIFRSFTNFVYRLVPINVLAAWDFTTNAISASVSWANSCDSVSFNQTVGCYPISLPPSLPYGEYWLLCYDSSSPAYSDTVILGKRFKWNGSVTNAQPLLMDS